MLTRLKQYFRAVFDFVVSIQPSAWIRGIRLRLLLPSIIQSAAILALCLVSLRFIAKINNDFTKTATVTLPMGQAMSVMATSVQELLRYGWSVYGDDGLSAKERSDRIDAALVLAAVNNFEEVEPQLTALIKDEAAQVIYKDVTSNWKTLRAAMHEKIPKMDENEKDYAKKAKHIFDSEARAAADPTLVAFAKLDALRAQSQKAEVRDTLNAASVARNIIPLVTVFCLLIAGFTALTMGNMISARLSRIAEELLGGAEQVTEVSQYVRSESNELASGATQVASAVEETRADIEGCLEMLGRTTKNAEKSVQMSENSYDVASQGAVVGQEVIAAIESIESSNGKLLSRIEKNSEEILEISQVITNIGAKTRVINEIVFQTKLLSFNASIEAARAGEQGRGFAVVADEVGKLAQMSGKAAQEIFQLLDKSVEKVKEIARGTTSQVAELLDTSKQTARKGVETANRCVETLRSIVENTAEVKAMVQEILQASQEQNQSFEEIARAIQLVDGTTQKTTMASHVTAKSSHELASQAASLKQLANRLVALVDGIKLNTGEQGASSLRSYSGGSSNADEHAASSSEEAA